MSSPFGRREDGGSRPDTRPVSGASGAGSPLLSTSSGGNPVDYISKRITANCEFTVLPPCRICEDKATGFHYGANTCEACKGFFRRSLLKGIKYKCKQKNRCNVEHEQKSSCAACRFQKCIYAGMSKDGIRRGWYTLEVKTSCIQEVKRLERQHRAEQQDNTKYSRLTNMVKMITLNHQLLSHYTPQFFEQIKQNEAAYHEQKRNLTDLFGPMKSLDWDAYDEIYNMTGIDIDGRLNDFQQHLPKIEENIKRFVSFAKRVPGFDELPVEDQIALVKDSNHACWILVVHQSINLEENLYTNSALQTFSRDEMTRIMGDEVADQFFKMAAFMKRLNMDTTEIALLKCICILSTDNLSDLQKRDHINELQWNIVEGLDYYVHSTYPDDPNRLARLLVSITEVRTSAIIGKKHKELTFKRVHLNNIPPLIMEVLAS